MAKIDYWLTEEGLTLMGGWAKDGLTDEEISKRIGISRSTLNSWKKKKQDISDTLKKGKEIVDYEVENSLLNRALHGDTTAMIFWLKNRKPDKWREKPEDTPSIDNKVTIVNDLPKWGNDDS